MKLNDTITTYDIAEALQGENGKFEVTSPTGERYFVTCQAGHSISSIEWAGGDLGGTNQEICGRLTWATPKEQARLFSAGLVDFAGTLARLVSALFYSPSQSA